jgi:hypothetical protein
MRFELTFNGALHILLPQLASDLFGVVAWHIFCFSILSVCAFPPQDGEKGHQETCIRLH